MRLCTQYFYIKKSVGQKILIKMDCQILKLMSFAFFLANLVEANKCFKENVTWSTKGQLEFIPQVDFQECTSAFAQNSDAKGFTWFEDFNGYKDICILFEELDGKQSCKKCLSFQQKGNCACKQQQGECEITENNFISASYAETEVECYIKCLAADGCEDYTWLSKDHDTSYEQCLLFSSCEIVNQCNQGCFVGSVNCVLPDLCSDVDYHILDDETRNVNYGYLDAYCDSTTSLSTSPDWKGTSWYRFDSPGGTKIPEHSLEYIHCNTYAPGWLNGTHPTNLGETVERKVCFNYPNHVCYFERNIQIKNCGAYFLYYLEDVYLNYRYCAETDF